MHRGSVLSLLVWALLYWAVATLSTHTALAQVPLFAEETAPPAQTKTPEPPAESIDGQRDLQQRPPDRQPDSGVQPVPGERQPAQAPLPPTDTRPETVEDNRYRLDNPHIALLLPLQSNAFRRYADAIRLGVLSAASFAQDPSLPVIVYATTEDTYQITDAYRRAMSSGARAVIGPLTRDGVSAVAASGRIEVPTLALNSPETEIRLPENLYVFGLQIEAEARAVARYAFREGGRKALVVIGETPVGRRIAQAFKEEWRRLKADVADEFVYSTEAATLGQLRQLVKNTTADAIFLSLDATRARFIRSYLGNRLPIYATSMVYASNADRLELYDLDGVRFVDMPWLLQPDHAAVMSYLRPDVSSAALDQERFYALGIDAYRVIRALLQRDPASLAIDGVTGAITLTRNRQIQREPVPAYFSAGTARLPAADAPR